MELSQEQYQNICSFLDRESCFPSFVEFRQEFNSIDISTLQSIYSTERVRKTKRTLHWHQSEETALKYWQWFSEMSSLDFEKGFLKNYADQNDICPALLAKILLEFYVKRKGQDASTEDCSSPKDKVAELLKEPGRISDPILSREIWLCILHDQVYGPIVESLKFVVGEEKEILLKKKLLRRNIPFLDEMQLREKGYDKTPDIKLEVPCVLNNKVIVNWIESKAWFGDPKSHATYLKNQYLTYVNRFGSGIVIYWSGFVDCIVEESKQEGIFIFLDLPTQLLSISQFYSEISGPSNKST